MKIRNFLRVSLLLSKAQMKSRYRKTIAGFLWVVLNPILLFGVHALIFKAILKVNIPNYFLFLLGGLLPWIFITNNIMMATNTFILQRDVIKSFSLSPISLICAHTIDNFINFFVAFLMLFIFLILTTYTGNISLYILLMSILCLFVFTISLTIVLATLQVFFRDVQFITQFFNNIMYLLTPIFYPPEYIPENFRWLVDINPYYILIRPFQLSLNNYTNSDYGLPLLYSILLSTFMAFLAFQVWKKAKTKIYHFI